MTESPYLLLLHTFLQLYCPSGISPMGNVGCLVECLLVTLQDMILLQPYDTASTGLADRECLLEKIMFPQQTSYMARVGSRTTPQFYISVWK